MKKSIFFLSAFVSLCLANTPDVTKEIVESDPDICYLNSYKIDVRPNLIVSNMCEFGSIIMIIENIKTGHITSSEIMGSSCGCEAPKDKK